MNEFDENNSVVKDALTSDGKVQSEAVAAEKAAPTAPAEPIEVSEPIESAEPVESAEAAEPTAIPTYAPAYVAPQPPKRKRNVGLIVFAILLAVTMLAATALAGGYALIHGVQEALPDGFGEAAPDYETDLQDRPDSAEEGSVSQVYYEAVDSVVLVQVYSKSDTAELSEASGVIYSEDGYIVTNDHVYADVPDPQFLVTLADGRQLDAQLVAGDARSDLAVLKINADDLTAASFGDSKQCLVGEQIITIGNPGGSALNFSMTQGVISAVDRWAANSSTYAMRYLQIDAAINSGNSGGALVNMYGQVIGIPSWKYTSGNFENVGFCIPSDTVVRVCDSLISHGYVADRVKLGVSYKAVDTIAAKIAGSDTPGLVIAEITPNTPFAASGAQVGDMITHVNGKKITESIVLLSIMENCVPGDELTLTILREDGTTFDATVELLEDRGSSSYSQGGTQEDSPASGGEFDFPQGE